MRRRRRRTTTRMGRDAASIFLIPFKVPSILLGTRRTGLSSKEKKTAQLDSTL